jgi:O-antigen ligase
MTSPTPSFLNSKTDLTGRIIFLLILLFLLVIPYNNRYITYLIIPWTILSVVFAFQQKIRMMDIIKQSSFFLIFYIISVLSLLYSEDFNHGIKTLEIQVSLIFMPFLLMVLKKITFKNKMKYLVNTYITGLIVYIIISVIIFFVRWDIKFIQNYLESFSLTDLTSNFQLSYFQHPAYISMYLLWAIVLVVNRMIHRRNSKSILLDLPIVIFFLLFIFVLGSRAGILTAFIIAIYYVWKFLRGLPRIFTIAVTILALVLTIFLMLKFTRIGDTVNNLKSSENLNGDMRIAIWTDAYEVFKEAPILGHGVGDGLELIIEKHRINGIADAYQYKFNAHNQFLETATQTGLIGLLSLILILVVPLINSISSRQELLFLVIMIVFINLLFESMLVRLAGVLFLGFWLNFLLIVNGNNESEINKNHLGT